MAKHAGESAAGSERWCGSLAMAVVRRGVSDMAKQADGAGEHVSTPLSWEPIIVAADVACSDLHTGDYSGVNSVAGNEAAKTTAVGDSTLCLVRRSGEKGIAPGPPPNDIWCRRGFCVGRILK